MNGDLTRSTFAPGDDFTAVRSQQGRVMLDADHNEQVDIQLDDTRRGRDAMIGGSGAPADTGGFAVTVAAGVPQLSAGLYFVDGLRVRNPAALALDGAQPFLGGPTLPTQDGAWLAYLDVWERPLTAVEEPSIREVALGGPDTTLRDQLVWQVRWLRVGNAGAGHCLSAAADLVALGQRYTGVLEPRLTPGGTAGPCVVSDAAAFRGLENQLYRVEIHTGNITADGTSVAQPPTFKWSRDNGAVIAAVVALTSEAPVTLQIDRLGPGGTTGFEIGRVVEIRDDAAVLSGQPGVLANVDDMTSDALELALLGGATVAQLKAVLEGRRVVVRRWDGAGAAISSAFTALEDGLEVRFDPTARYRTGDAWLIPARTATLPATNQQLDWPVIAPGSATFVTRRPDGVEHRRVGLALLDRTGGAWTTRSDCRRLFPPLTSIWALALAGGDGQHARSGDWLPAPLDAVLTRGSVPLAGARLRFTVITGGGQISASAPSAPSPVTSVDVTTDAGGRGRVYFRLGGGPVPRDPAMTWEPALAQTVAVQRLGPDGAPVGAALRFVAQPLDHFNLSIVGGNGQQGRPGETLEIALRVRIDDGQRPVSNATVEFAVQNRIFAGTPLNEDQGGSVHASARFVSGTIWPSGSRYHTVRTTTDADGVAQVQWMLGRHLPLTTQRVSATLLDGAGNGTPQAALFLAQLALAREITWQPLVPWLAALLGGRENVQAAIDELAARIDQVATNANLADPFVGIQWRRTSDNARAALNRTASIPWTDLAAVVFRSDLVPAGRDVGQVSAHGGVRVYAELPDGDSRGLARVVQLRGTLARAADGTWEWRLSSEARAAVVSAVGASAGNERKFFPIRVDVVPRWLPGGLANDSVVVHELLFNAYTGVRLRLDVDPIEVIRNPGRFILDNG